MPEAASGPMVLAGAIGLSVGRRGLCHLLRRRLLRRAWRQGPSAAWFTSWSRCAGSTSKTKIIYTVVACFLAGLLAQACVGIGFGVNLDLIMIGDIMLFIPGLVIVNGVREFFYADILTGLYRLVEALLIAGAIAAGYAVSLMMGGSL